MKKIIVLISVFGFPGLVNAQNLGLNFASNIGLRAANQTDPQTMAVDVVKYLITFVGIFAVSIIIIGGFKWMVSGGNAETVMEARKMLTSGMIGLAIILTSYAFVDQIVKITGQVLAGSL